MAISAVTKDPRRDERLVLVDRIQTYARQQRGGGARVKTTRPSGTVGLNEDQTMAYSYVVRALTDANAQLDPHQAIAKSEELATWVADFSLALSGANSVSQLDRLVNRLELLVARAARQPLLALVPLPREP
jgi:hypothetical protein